MRWTWDDLETPILGAGGFALIGILLGIGFMAGGGGLALAIVMIRWSLQ